MPGRRPAEAVERFVAPIRDAVSCVVRQPSLTGANRGYHPKHNPHVLALNDGQRVRMGNSGLSISLNQTYDVVEREGEYKVSTREYIYSIYDKDTGAKDDEVVGFHYHPNLTPTVDFFHMHFRRLPEYKGVHFPTGRIAIEEVVAMLIRDFGVSHRREDYEDVILRGLEAFREWRTWSSRGTM